MNTDSLRMFRNNELDRGDWLDRVLFDEGQGLVKTEKTFEDPAITLDIQTLSHEKIPVRISLMNSHDIVRSQSW